MYGAWELDEERFWKDFWLNRAGALENIAEYLTGDEWNVGDLVNDDGHSNGRCFRLCYQGSYRDCCKQN